VTRSVLLVSGTLAVGGAERVISEMANYWAARGWSTTLATLTSPQVPDFYRVAPTVERCWLDDGAARKSRWALAGAMLRRTRALRRLILERRPDAVLSFIDVPNIVTIVSGLGLDCRIVVSERGTLGGNRSLSMYELGLHWRVLRWALYRRAAAVTALNEQTAAWLARHCGVSVEVVPPALRPLPTVKAAREPLILGVGRYHRVKGFDLLIRAFARVSREFPGWRLVLLGEGPEGECLEALAAELGIADRIELRAPAGQIEEWLARAGIVVQPSRSEAFGNALLEAMAMAAPVVSTACAGPASLIRDGANGRIVPVEDIGALAAALRELLADPALRDRFGGAASQVREAYRQDRVMARWESILFRMGAPA